MAGGTDLMLRLRDGDLQTRCIIDITRLPELKIVSRSGDYLLIGAGITHAGSQSERMLKDELPLLSEASSHVGTPQVRNQATVLGNIINAQPAADTAVALCALGAEICVESKRGRSWLPICDLYEGVGHSRIDSTREIATAIRCKPIKRGEGWSYLRIRGRNDLWLPSLNSAVWVSIEDAKILSCRISLGPVAAVLFRAKQTEDLLTASRISLPLIERAAQESMMEASPRESLFRGSTDYRRELARVLVRRSLLQALERAGVKL
jgi:CO/xanthine dehydrogenase FAD-binding subunit